MTWGGWWRNKFQTQLSFSSPVVKGKCSWQPFRKNLKSQNKVKPPQQDNILRIPNCWRSAVQNDNGKSNPSRHSGHQHQSTTDKCGRAPGGKRILLNYLWEFTLATVSRMDSFWMPEKKKPLRLKLGSDIPTPWPMSWENHWSKGTDTPTKLQPCFR